LRENRSRLVRTKCGVLSIPGVSMMKKLIVSTFALAVFSGGALYAQNFNGTWQGTLKVPRELRIVVKISVGADDKLKADLYSIDQQSPAIPASQISRDGSTL